MTDEFSQKAAIAGEACGLRPEQWPGLAHIFRTIAAEEREACAKLVEAEGNCRHVEHVQGHCECQPKADAIRARGAQQ